MKNTTGSSVETSKESNRLPSNSILIDWFYLEDQPTGISIGSSCIGMFIQKEGDFYRSGNIEGSRDEVIEAVSWMIEVISLAGRIALKNTLIWSNVIMKKNEDGKEYPVLLTQESDKPYQEEHPLISVQEWAKKSDQDPVKENIKYIIGSVNDTLENRYNYSSEEDVEEDRVEEEM